MSLAACPAAFLRRPSRVLLHICPQLHGVHRVDGTRVGAGTGPRPLLNRTYNISVTLPTLSSWDSFLTDQSVKDILIKRDLKTTTCTTSPNLTSFYACVRHYKTAAERRTNDFILITGAACETADPILSALSCMNKTIMEHLDTYRSYSMLTSNVMYSMSEKGFMVDN